MIDPPNPWETIPTNGFASINKNVTNSGTEVATIALKDNSIINISTQVYGGDYSGISKSTTVMTELTLSADTYYFEMTGYEINVVAGFAYDGYDHAQPIGYAPGTAGLDYSTGAWVCEGVSTPLFATMTEFTDLVRNATLRLEVDFSSRQVNLIFSDNTSLLVDLPVTGTNFSAAVSVLQNPDNGNKYVFNEIIYRMGRYYFDYQTELPTMYDPVDTGGGF